MNQFQTLIENQVVRSELASFLKKYGILGLREAMQIYINNQKEYICRTRNSMSKLKMDEIYFLEIHGHRITVHTEHEMFLKYGSLKKELMLLSPNRFVKCSRNCIVSLNKIKSIGGNDIILINKVRLHISRNYASEVLLAFYKNNCFFESGM